MRSASRRGRRSRPSSLALEEQVEVPPKRTRSAHSSPAAVPPTRPGYSRRQEQTSRNSTSNSASRNSSNHDTTTHKEPSPIPELPLDEDSPPPMPSLDSKAATLADVVKRRGSRDSKRPITPLPLPKVAELNDEGHISDLSSLSELDDSEAETERLEDSPRKGAPKSVYTYSQPSKPTPLKISQELKPNKSPELEPVPEEEGSPTSKKRKRENGETELQKESVPESKTSRPATPLNSKGPIPPEKNKKAKPVDANQEKPVGTPMEGVEAIAVTDVNGKESSSKVENTEVDAPAPNEEAPNTEVEEDAKEVPPAVPEADADEETIEGAEMPREDEEDAERSQRRKAAMDALTQIELEFAKLRDKLYEERISDIDEEIRLVNEGTHPELLAMMEAVNKRRDDKIRLYNVQLKYALQARETAMKTTRAQYHSQYAQQVREIRERYLDTVSEGLYQIQRERRASDMVVQDYTYRISDCSNTRLRERQAYMMEVSILSGIAKYIGFPAAPEVKGAAPSEMQADLEAMGIVSRMSVRGGSSRALDDYQEMQRPYWANRTAPPSPPPGQHHHHHHHPHSHPHHHHSSHPQDQPIPQRRAPGSSIPNPATHMPPVTPLPLSALLQVQESGHIKMEQGQHTSGSLLPPQPMTMSHASRSPLHNYRPPPPPQAHIHQLQQHQHPGESSLAGAERSRILDEKDIGGPIQPLGIARYAPVGKGYV